MWSWCMWKPAWCSESGTEIDFADIVPLARQPGRFPSTVKNGCREGGAVGHEKSEPAMEVGVNMGRVCFRALDWCWRLEGEWKSSPSCGLAAL